MVKTFKQVSAGSGRRFFSRRASTRRVCGVSDRVYVRVRLQHGDPHKRRPFGTTRFRQRKLVKVLTVLSGSAVGLCRLAGLGNIELRRVGTVGDSVEKYTSTPPPRSRSG